MADKEALKKIYLQLGPYVDSDDLTESCWNSGETTWASSRVFDTDVEYVRADVVARLTRERDEARAAVREAFNEGYGCGFNDGGCGFNGYVSPPSLPDPDGAWDYSAAAESAKETDDARHLNVPAPHLPAADDLQAARGQRHATGQALAVLRGIPANHQRRQSEM